MSIGLSPSDFISIPQFAWNVYKACRDCTGDYRALASEAASLHRVLSEVAENIKECELSLQSAERLAILGNGCQDVLERVEKTVASYDALKSEEVTLMAKLRRGKKRVKWVMESPGEIRTQLMMHISLLSLFNSSLAATLTSKSHSKTQEQLCALLQQVAKLDVPSSANYEPLNQLAETQMGIIQACWGCKVLATECGPGNPCSCCILREKRFCQLQCRRGPLANLARDIIPEFFLPSFYKSNYQRHESVNQNLINTASGTNLIFQWAEISLELPMQSTLKDVEDSFDHNLYKLISEFQESFPDRHGFRQKLIEIAIDFQKTAQCNAVKLAFKFLILAFVISHIPWVLYEGLLIPCHCKDTWLEVKKCFSTLMYKTLQSVLKEIETLAFNKNRQDWPILCFSLALLLTAAESLQVDIFLDTKNEQKSEEGCQAMQINGLYILVELFLVRTSGFNPLILDWDLAENKLLLDGDQGRIEAIQDLQLLSQSYWTFLRDRKNTKFTEEDTDCLTGKLTAHIL